MNKVTSIAVGALAALALVAAPSRASAQQDQQTRPGASSSTDSSANSSSTTSSSSVSDTGMAADTTHHRAGHMRHGVSDSAKSNQSKSGVTNTKTRKSTLGKKVFKTRPDEDQPVMSKGDTIRKAADSASIHKSHDSTSGQSPR